MTAKETIELAEARKDIQYMQKDLNDLKEAVRNLPDELMAKLDERYAQKNVVEELQETIAPLTKFRKRLWQMVVFAVFTAATVAVIMWEIQRFKTD